MRRSSPSWSGWGNSSSVRLFLMGRDSANVAECKIKAGIMRFLFCFSLCLHYLCRVAARLSGLRLLRAGILNKITMEQFETVTFKGMAVHTNGTMPRKGGMAPEFTAVAGDLSELTLSSLRGRRVVLNIFPSLDTSVCATSVRKFNVKAAQLDNVQVLAVSMDLPFAQGRFCSTEGIERVKPVSLFRSKDFAENYGLMMTDGPLAGLAARAVIVVDEDGRVAYAQLVPEITEEPDYESALAVLK